jgi:aspartyl-tRNA(Asn)/glutamyl-tRNA(Gln) amidotransferase subunit A
MMQTTTSSSQRVRSGAKLSGCAADLASGRTTSAALVEECLARIGDEAGQGRRTFIHVDKEGARAAAQAMDRRRARGSPPSPFAGIPISIKDLFDVTGQVTTAGSRVLGTSEPAPRDAPSVARLRSAGFVLIGRTNMTEFGYSCLGLNPHFGTPASAWQRERSRVPGGSSSGAAVSVADGMAYGAIGTDTAGSCRVPAAFNGLVGYKPSTGRVPTDGIIPLSTTLDSIGPIARSVECCSILDRIMADETTPSELARRSIGTLTFGVPQTTVLDDLAVEVARAFERALSTLSAAGARIREIEMPEFAQVASLNREGGFSASESFAWHRPLIEARREGYDPRVLVRIERGRHQSAAHYIEITQQRKAMVEHAHRRIAELDALLMPTVSIVPPTIEACARDADYDRLNAAVLRNPAPINVIDACAISIPIHEEGAAPVGLTIAARHGSDRDLFAIAAAAESILD